MKQNQLELRQVAIIVCVLGSGLAGVCNHATAVGNWWRLGGEGGVSWKEVGDFGLLTDDSTAAGALQPFELKPGENLLPRLGPWQRLRFSRDPVSHPGHPRLWQGHGNLFMRTHNENLGNFDILYMAAPDVFVDGDPSTYVERRVRVTPLHQRPPSGSSYYYTIDMGAQVPVERFVFYPPMGVSPYSDQPFYPNYILKSFSLTARQDEGGIMKEEVEPGFRWRRAGFCCPLETQLAYREANRDSVTEVRFPLQNVRYLRLLEVPDGIDLEGQPTVVQSAHAEMEVNFGRVVFKVSKWRKDGAQLVAMEEVPVRVQVEIRTGRDDTPTDYFGFDDLGAHVEVTKKQWEQLTASVPGPLSLSSLSTLQARGAMVPMVGFRGPVTEDLKNWSIWSVPLTESGQYPDLPWGRYFQLRVQLLTDAFFDFARMDSLQIEIAPLLSDRIVGEVVLEREHQPQGGRVRVPVGEKISFVYDVGVEFSSADRTGFDVVRVMTPAEAEFSWLEIGEPLGAAEPDSIVNGESGFLVFLPRRISPEGDRRLRIGLETTLYDEAGEFGGEVFNRGEQSMVQRIEGGDVSTELGSNQLAVLGIVASARGVLGELRLGHRAFTPQGDGVNDHLSIGYTLFRVRRAVVVKVGVYALDGRQIWQAQPQVRSAGRYAVRWDGRAGTGQLVGPGVYLARVEVKTDRGSEIRLQPVAVAY